MYGCESWTMKTAEHCRIDAFEPWCWRRLLRVPWTARRSNQSILKEINPELEVLMSWSSNTWATCCEELTHWERPWCWERLTAGGEGDDRGWDGWMASPTQWTRVWVSSGRWWWTGRPGVLQSMGHKELDPTEQLNNKKTTAIFWIAFYRHVLSIFLHKLFHMIAHCEHLYMPINASCTIFLKFSL